MDKKELYEKVEKALNHAFEVAKQSAKTVSEKAGETAYLTKLLLEKMTLEHRVSRQFTKLGNTIYQKSIREGKEVSLQDEEVKKLLEETKQMEVELAQVEATLDAERLKKKEEKPPQKS